MAPGPGLTLADKQTVNTALLKSGATISEMNCVRRHLSALKCGRLAAACHPARVLTLLISDVPGDDPVDIASGPTVPDPTTCADALSIVECYRVELPDAVRALLDSGGGESVKPGDARIANIETRMITARRWRLQRPPPNSVLNTLDTGMLPVIHDLGTTIWRRWFDKFETDSTFVPVVVDGVCGQIAFRSPE